MIKGRQVTWMVYDHSRLSDIDGAMLNWDELLRVELKMPGDNIKQYPNYWDTKTSWNQCSGDNSREVLC